MNERNEQRAEQESLSGKVNPGHGPQGVDKAPGEEPSSDNIQFTQQTQKGKNTVDGDLSDPKDRPLDEQDV